VKIFYHYQFSSQESEESENNPDSQTDTGIDFIIVG
jgi:hypothetical protein